jgi:SAM-dependent methyltransferase
MARLGADVVAFDFSERFVERARQHTEEAGIKNVEYHVIDATDRDALLALGSGSFDAAVCTMALMDMSDIGPLLSVLPALLRPGGRFVLSVTHPCFNGSGCRIVAEQEDREGELVTTFGVKVVAYRDVPAQRGLGIIGQPVPHFYFHRTLSELFGACFRAGLVLDGLEEPVSALAPSAGHLSWGNLPQVPPVLVARMRAAV